MLRTWKVENFKSIRKAELELARINLIVGANSIGKSSLVQSIVGFAQLGEQAGRDQKSISLNGPSLSLGAAPAVTHHGGPECAFGGIFSHQRMMVKADRQLEVGLKKRSERDYDFELATRSERVPIVKDYLYLEINSVGHKITFRLSDSQGHKSEEIATLTESANEEGFEGALTFKSWLNELLRVRFYRDFSYAPGRLADRSRPSTLVKFENELWQIFTESISANENIEAFREFIQEEWRNEMPPSGNDDQAGPRKKLDEKDGERLKALEHIAFLAKMGGEEKSQVALEQFNSGNPPLWKWLSRHWSIFKGFESGKLFARSISYLGPLRVVGVRDQKNYRSFSQLTPLGPSGEHLASLLLNEGRVTRKYPVPGNSEMQDLTLIAALDLWNKFLNLDAQVRSEGDRLIGARIRIGKFSLDNVGTGISQVTPVITIALWAASQGGKTIILEQPELHLHPSLQRRLADFIFELSRHNCQFIIETHSEYLVTRLRLLRARGDLLGGDLRVFFAEAKGSKKEGVRAEFRTIEVGDKGYLSDWPEGFLDGVEVDQHAIAAIQMLP